MPTALSYSRNWIQPKYMTSVDLVHPQPTAILHRGLLAIVSPETRRMRFAAAHESESGPTRTFRDVRFSNRPFGVKRFRTIRDYPRLQCRCRSRARASLRNRPQSPCMGLLLSRSSAVQRMSSFVSFFVRSESSSRPAAGPRPSRAGGCQGWPAHQRSTVLAPGSLVPLNAYILTSWLRPLPTSWPGSPGPCWRKSAAMRRASQRQPPEMRICKFTKGMV